LRQAGAARQATADAPDGALGGVFTGDSVIRFS